MSRLRTDEELEAEARGLRQQLGMEFETQLDLGCVLKKLAIIRPGFKYEQVADWQMTDAEAQWDSERQTIRLRESVFKGMQAQHPRARWTVAHEIGHFQLQHGGIRNRSLAKTAAEKFVSQVRHEESEAKRFASIFLAPAYLVGPEQLADDLRQTFGISLESAAIRRIEVNELIRRAEGKPRELPSVVVDFLREAKRRGQNVTVKIDD